MKRALFRLGKKFRVESVSQDSSFKMEVDVDKWKKGGDSADKPENWQFKFSEYEEGLKVKYPANKQGTTIVVEKLHQDVIDAFELDTEITALISELQREHLFSIDQGMDIYVNGNKLVAPELELLTSKNFKTARWEKLGVPVKVELYAGISEQEKYGPSGGWYIFCNKRLVLGPDQTKVTGWGAKKPIRIPDYHSQFYRFRGYAFFDATNPKNLPWNTSKTNIDLDSPIYRATLQQMITLMRSVINFLNKLHDEATDISNNRIKETPLHTAIEQAKPTPLKDIRKSPSKYTANAFAFPDPAKPTNPKPAEVAIKYSIPKEKYNLVKEYFNINKPKEIGLKTFDYFFEREIEN